MEDLALGCKAGCARRGSSPDDWCVIEAGAGAGALALAADKHRWYKAYTVKDIFKVRFTAASLFTNNTNLGLGPIKAACSRILI